jgi:hypothetical protein
MITSLLYCLTMAWTPSSGDVASYDLLIDGLVNQTGIVEPEAAVCFEDQGAHIVTVRAKNAAGDYGPMSDGSDAVERHVLPPFFAHPMDTVTRSDIDENGTVGMPDFLLFAGVYGKCNDGQVEAACP